MASIGPYGLCTCRSSGRYFTMGSSSESRPRSRSCMIAMPVKVLVIEAQWKIVSASTGRRACRSAYPNVRAWATRWSRTRTKLAPTMACSVRRASKKRSNAASGAAAPGPARRGGAAGRRLGRRDGDEEREEQEEPGEADTVADHGSPPAREAGRRRVSAARAGRGPARPGGGRPPARGGTPLPAAARRAVTDCPPGRPPVPAARRSGLP